MTRADTELSTGNRNRIRQRCGVGRRAGPRTEWLGEPHTRPRRHVQTHQTIPAAVTTGSNCLALPTVTARWYCLLDRNCIVGTVSGADRSHQKLFKPVMAWGKAVKAPTAAATARHVAETPPRTRGTQRSDRVVHAAARLHPRPHRCLHCRPHLVQDQVARAHVAWPWGDTGGFMTLDSSMSSRSGPTKVAKE